MSGRQPKTSRMLAMMVVTILVSFVFGFADLLAAPPQGVLKQVTHVAISADWLDPATTSAFSISSYMSLYLLQDALVKPMPEGNYTPCLAESWSISPDYKVYEFRLRKGVKFHNGDTMNADDVVFSFLRYKATQAKVIQGRVEKVEALNPNLVRFQFKNPFPDFLEYLLPGGTAAGWVVPKKYVEKVGDAGFKKNPIGAGPYKFVEFVPGVRLVGEAFEDYWRKVPSIKRIELITIPETTTRLAMVRRGEADIATFMTDVSYEDAKKDPKLRVLHPKSASRDFVYMTSQWDPKSPWSDVRVRKAASFAIDRRSLADIHKPGVDPIGSLGLEGDPEAVKFPVDPYDPEQARKFLAEAGYPTGFHGGKFYPYGGYWPQGEQMVTYWKAVGISVDTVLLERAAWIAQREGGKMRGGIFFDVAAQPTIGGVLASLFGPASYGNYPDIQSLWDQYMKAVSPKVRKDLIAEIQRLIYEKRMFLPLNPASSPAAFGPRVKGNPYRVQPLIWFTAPFEDMELEK